jgi:hypothetical protein
MLPCSQLNWQLRLGMFENGIFHDVDKFCGEKWYLVGKSG